MSDSHFDQKAADWNDRPGVRKNAANFCEEVRRSVEIRSDMRILDFGCGTGLVGLSFASEVRTVGLLDISHGMIEATRKSIAEQMITNTEVYEDDVRNITAEPFDLVLAALVLHHVEDLDSTIEGIKKVMKPGAQLVACEFDPSQAPHNPHIVTIYSEEQLKAKFEAAGFVEVTTRQLTPLEFPGPDGDGHKKCFGLFAKVPF